MVSKKRTTVARALAPEDIAPGDYVVALKRVVEVPALLLCDAQPWERERVLRIELTAEEKNPPLEVLSVCLPFVVVRRQGGERSMLDVRLARLAAVPEEFVRALRKGDGGEKRKGGRKKEDRE